MLPEVGVKLKTVWVLSGAASPEPVVSMFEAISPVRTDDEALLDWRELVRFRLATPSELELVVRGLLVGSGAC